MISFTTHDASIKLDQDDNYMVHPTGPKGPIAVFMDDYICVLRGNGYAYYITSNVNGIQLKDKKQWFIDPTAVEDSELKEWNIVLK